MPARSSDLHEFAVLFGLIRDHNSYTDQAFNKFCQDYSANKIFFENEELKAYQNLIQRAFKLAGVLKFDLKLTGRTGSWEGQNDIKSDCADIKIDDKYKISLKDSSLIVRNNGFEQLLSTFCKNPPKIFKDPFVEFAPRLSANYLNIVTIANLEMNFLKIKNGKIFIQDDYIGDGNLDFLSSLSVAEYIKFFKLKNIKILIKNFANSKDYSKQLLKIRSEITKSVSEKLISVFKEGIRDKSHTQICFKKLLQYDKEKKYFGLSSVKLFHVGVISEDKDIEIVVTDVKTKASKLTERTTGLQLNVLTSVSIKVGRIGFKDLIIENQVRYKHKTFSCAPEANTHLTSINDWKIIFPSIKELG